MFTKEKVRILKNDIVRCLQEEFKDLEITTKGATYDSYEITYKIIVKPKKVNGEDTERLIWEDTCRWYGLPKEMYGRKIILNGKEFKIIAIDKNARKNCIIIKDKLGKRYKTDIRTIETRLGKESGINE